MFKVIAPASMMISLVLLSILSPARLTSAQELSGIQVGDEICAEGFVMDSVCINRGTLLDNPRVVSLEGPDQHSVHCLVDITSCHTSPFEILVAPYSDNQTVLHSRGWRLDDAGRESMVELGRSVGRAGGCTTCGNAGDLEKGFRAAVKAKILSLDVEEDFLIPEVQLIGDPIHSNDLEGNICQTSFNMTNILDILTEAEKNLLFTTETGASFQNWEIVHGSMMLIGWGLLLPSGVIFGRFFKHRPDGLWFKIHKTFQQIGLLFALTGWIIALVNFNVFMDRDIRFAHGLVGSLVMVFGLMQPLNALFRPHIIDGEEKTMKRKIWEHFHKGAGWSCVFLAVAVIIVGTTMLPKPSDQMIFQITYAVGCIGVLISFLVFIKFDKEKYTKLKEEEALGEHKEDSA